MEIEERLIQLCHTWGDLRSTYESLEIAAEIEQILADYPELEEVYDNHFPL